MSEMDAARLKVRLGVVEEHVRLITALNHPLTIARALLHCSDRPQPDKPVHQMRAAFRSGG